MGNQYLKNIFLKLIILYFFLRSRRNRRGVVESIELDRSSIARLLEKLRDEDCNNKGSQGSIDSGGPKRSYDRRQPQQRNRRSDAATNEMELDCLLSSKNSNRSDRSRKSDTRRSRSKQESSLLDDEIDNQ